MYGFKTREEAQQKATELSARYPQNQYEVGVHKHPERHWWSGREDKTVTYGVKRYIPYTVTVPWRFDGFVWF